MHTEAIWAQIFEVIGMIRPGKCSTGKAGFDPGSDALGPFEDEWSAEILLYRTSYYLKRI